MQTLDTIRSRRSIRSYTAEPLSDQDMQTILQAAADAPSASNAQNWKFVTLQNPQKIASLRAFSPGIIGMPAALILLCLDHSLAVLRPEGKLNRMPYYDIGGAMQNILLAAHDLGLGACASGSFQEKPIRVFLQLPDSWELCLLICLGHPKMIPSAPHKKPLSETWVNRDIQ